MKFKLRERNTNQIWVRNRVIRNLCPIGGEIVLLHVRALSLFHIYNRISEISREYHVSSNRITLAHTREMWTPFDRRALSLRRGGFAQYPPFSPRERNAKLHLSRARDFGVIHVTRSSIRSGKKLGGYFAGIPGNPTDNSPHICADSAISPLPRGRHPRGVR